MHEKEFSQQTVLVTGATGLIGEHLCRRLIQEGARVIALSRSEEKLKTCFGDLLESGGFRYIAQDVLAPFVTDETVDVIFHAAGPIASDIIRNRPMEVIAPNLFGTDHLLTFLRKQKETRGVSGKMVLCSSATVYANPTDQDICVKEEDACYTDGLQAYNAAYAQSKRMMEVMADAYYRQFGVDNVIARLSYVYGPAAFKANTAFYEFLDKASRGDVITVNNPCMEKRDWIYIDDAVDGLLLLSRLPASERVFNVSSGGEGNSFLAADEIAAIAANIYNKNHPDAPNPSRVLYNESAEGKRKPGIMLDHSKIKRYGFRLKNDIYAGIAKTMTGSSAL